jgi:tetratricopeptide (TPR) repeat protein
MEARFAPSIMCPILIGRVHELTTLRLLADRAKSGQGQVALPSGEAGIGKSRLVVEVKTTAASHDFLLLQGSCFPTDHAIPYAPLLDLLRSFLNSHALALPAPEVKQVAQAFLPLLPDLGHLLPGGTSPPTLTPLDPEQEKRRRFEILAHFLTSQARVHPVLLVVEDLHWSDDTSLEFLHYLARRCSAHQLLLLLTYRSDEAHPSLRHFFEASAWEKTLEYGQRAGEQAQAMYAPHAAIDQVTRALDAALRGSIPPPASLYRLRGQAYETLGDFEWARPDYETTLQMAQRASDRHAEWQALMDLGFLWAERDYTRTGAYCQQALELARCMDDPLTLAHSLNRLGNWHVNIEQPREALRYHQEALTLFQQAHDSPGIAETCDLLGMASTLDGDLVQGAAYCLQAVALFRELDDRQGLTSSLTLLAELGGIYQSETMVPATISFAESLHFGEQALKIAREIGQRPAEAYTLFSLAHYLGPHGEYARALEMAQAGLALAEQIEHRQWITFGYWILGTLYLDLLVLPQARTSLEHALALAHEVGSWNWIRIVSGFLAPAYLLQQDLAQTDSILTAALESGAAMQTIGQRKPKGCCEPRKKLRMYRGCDPGSGAFVLPWAGSIKLRGNGKKPSKYSQTPERSSRSLLPTSQTSRYGSNSYVKPQPCCRMCVRFHQTALPNRPLED